LGYLAFYFRDWPRGLCRESRIVYLVRLFGGRDILLGAAALVVPKRDRNKILGRRNPKTREGGYPERNVGVSNLAEVAEGHERYRLLTEIWDDVRALKLTGDYLADRDRYASYRRKYLRVLGEMRSSLLGS
jgi:hypothetical protein